MKIIFFGTPSFAAKVLAHLLENGIAIEAVVTKPDKPKGRSGTPLSPPVKQIAITHQPPIPVLQPEKASDLSFASDLAQFNADLFVVVAYGEIVKEHVLNLPKTGCINLHASLLPKYRGAAPIQRAVMNGETETGITIMRMVKKMDAGDMLSSVRVPIGPDDTFGEVETKLCDAGARLLLEVIRQLERGSIDQTAQDEAQATFAPKVELEDCEIQWSKPASSLHNLVRGSNPYPGAWCWVLIKGEKKRLKVIASRVANEKGNPGEIVACSSKGMTVGCGLGSLLILKLQLEGKRPMTPEELQRGLSIEFL